MKFQPFSLFFHTFYQPFSWKSEDSPCFFDSLCQKFRKKASRKKKVRKKSRTTEFSITIVLCCLVAVLTVKGISLQQKVNANASRLSSLDSQIEEEKQRTDDITALKEYMQTDEYIEKTAREKLGMVKDNEILFKESQSK